MPVPMLISRASSSRAVPGADLYRKRVKAPMAAMPEPALLDSSSMITQMHGGNSASVVVKPFDTS